MHPPPMANFAMRPPPPYSPNGMYQTLPPPYSYPDNTDPYTEPYQLQEAGDDDMKMMIGIQPMKPAYRMTAVGGENDGVAGAISTHVQSQPVPHQRNVETTLHM